MRRVTRIATVLLLTGLGLLGLVAALRASSTDEGSPLWAREEPASGDPPISGALRRLTYDGDTTPLAWTADGSRVLVRRPGEMWAGQQLSELWAISMASGRVQRIADNAFRPAPHGDEVAYLSFLDRNQWTVMRSDLAGRNQTEVGRARWEMPPTWAEGELLYLGLAGQLLTQGGQDGPLLPRLASLDRLRVRLSAEGQHVALSDGRTLWVVSAEAGPAVVDNAAQIWGLSWSPAGPRLAYVRADDGPMPQLWVWDARTGRSRLLVQEDMAILGVPTWSPDGQMLAYARCPTGSGPNAAGDIWLVDVEGTGPHPLALTPADERAPAWSPDGSALAFSLQGDVWVADLGHPDLRSALETAAQDADTPSIDPTVESSTLAFTPLSLSAPYTIRVKHDDVGNICRDRPPDWVDVYPFEDYVKRVVPHEMPPSWPTETLKTQAVAARTYAWRKAISNRPPYSDPGYDVWDSTLDQYMCDAQYPRTNAAVDATESQYISYNGYIIYAFYCAEAGSPTNFTEEHNLSLAPYLRPVDNPVGFGRTRNGHSWGMSQWGAFYWAAWHGWDYQQILTHYYSFAAIERSSTLTEPLVGLTLPWADHYVRSNYAYLQANGADSGAVLTVTFAARIAGAWTTIHTDADGSDGWSYAWPVAALTDTYTPSIELRAAAYDDAGQVSESPASDVGIHRTPPTGTLGISSTAVSTFTVTLTTSASDPLPVSGAIRVGLGNDDWAWEDTELTSVTGTIEVDSLAGDGSAWHAYSGMESLLVGPQATNLPAGRQYSALFRIRVPTQALSSGIELARLDVTADGGDSLLGIRYLRGTDLLRGGSYLEFAVDFDYPASGGPLEFRTRTTGAHDVWLDRVRVITHPVDLPPQVAWTLPARTGLVTVTAKYVDGAGNLSDDVSLVLVVGDDAPPGEWQGFRCGASCVVEVRDALAGLDVSSAAYQFSTDGGTSWSGWLPATCSGVDGTQGWETVTTADIPFGSGETRVQFRIADLADPANEGQSPVYAVRRVFLPLVTRNLGTSTYPW